MLGAFKNVVDETMRPYKEAGKLADIDFESSFEDIDFESSFQSIKRSTLEDIDFEPSPTPIADLKSDKVKYSFEPSDKSSPYMPSITAAEKKHGLPPNLLANLIQAESGFDPNAKSPAGAEGMLQIMRKFHPNVDPADPEASIKYAAGLLEKHHKRFGDWDSALAAYNAGPGRVNKGMDKLPLETRNYLEKINAFKVKPEQAPIVEDLESTDIFREPGIYQEPEGKEKSLISQAWESVTKRIRDKKADAVKSANAVAMAEEFGISPSQAYDNLDMLSKEVGLRGQPTFQELIEGMAVPPIALGMLMNPIATTIGVGTFMGLSEVENTLISTHPGVDYEFGAGKGFQELLPEDTSQGVKDLVWTADQAWKAMAGGGIGKKITPVIYSGMQTLYTKFTKDISVKYNLPKEFFISPEKIREFHGRGREGVISRAESDMLKGLGLDRRQYIDALKQGIDVKISSEKIISAVDKPWFAGLKKIIGARPYSLEFTKAQKPTVTTHMERLAPPVKSVPRPVTRPVDAKPEFKFVSQKGHRYEKIGDKWYGSKGREITNKYVIAAAEKGKVGFESTDELIDRTLQEVPEKEDGKKIKRTEPTVTEEYGSPEEILAEESEPLKLNPEESLFRQTAEDTVRNLEILPKYNKIDTPEQLMTRIESEINSELNGIDDATNARGLLGELNIQAKLWASGDEIPGGIFSDMDPDELVTLSEYLDELDSWAKDAEIRTEVDPFAGIDLKPAPKVKAEPFAPDIWQVEQLQQTLNSIKGVGDPMASLIQNFGRDLGSRLYDSISDILGKEGDFPKGNRAEEVFAKADRLKIEQTGEQGVTLNMGVDPIKAASEIIGDIKKVLQRSDLEKLRAMGWSWKQASLEQTPIGNRTSPMFRDIEPTPGRKRPVVLVPPKDEPSVRLNAMIPLDEVPRVIKGIVNRAKRKIKKLTIANSGFKGPRDVIKDYLEGMDTIEESRAKGMTGEISSIHKTPMKDLYRNKKIWEKTGYWLDKQGNWRYEIPTELSLTKLKSGMFNYKGLESVGSLPLPEVLKVSKLYKGVPGLKNVTVKYDPHSGSLGSYNPVTRTITIKDYNDYTSLSHEVQHAVEHFANTKFRGSNVTAQETKKIELFTSELIASAKSEEVRKLAIIFRDDYRTYFLHPDAEPKVIMSDLYTAAKKNPEDYWKLRELDKRVFAEDPIDSYMKEPGEALARLESKRSQMSDHDRNAEAPWETLDKMLESEGIEPKGVELYSGIPVDKIVKNLGRIHPATYTKNIIKLMSDIAKELGATDILDIFGGVGKIGRIKDYGFKGNVRTNELQPKWGGKDTIKENQKNKVDSTTIGDSRKLDVPDESVGAIFTSPTYGNRMGTTSPSKTDHYQAFAGGKLEKGNTGGMVWGPEYERLHKEIYNEAFRVVKPGGFFVLNMKDMPVGAKDLKNRWIPKQGSEVEVLRNEKLGKDVMRATDWHVKTLEDAGFKVIDKYEVPESKQSVGTQSFGRKFTVGYEDVVVMGKSDSAGKAGGVKLRDITLYSGIPVQELYDKLTAPKKTKVKVPSKPPDPFPGVKEEARGLVRKRTAGLGLANYETNRFINDLEQKITSKQDEVLPFLLEKTDVPDEFNRPDLQKVLVKDKEYLKPIANDIKEWFNTGWKNIKKQIPDLTIKQIEDYVTHLWDIPKHKKAEATSWFSTQNQFLEKRFIDTYAEGIERGYKPKNLKITEIIKVHDAVTNRAIENAKYVKALLAMNRDGTPLIERSDNAPLDWIEVDYPALTRRIKLKPGEAKRKGGFVKESKVRVHPDLVRPLKVIFEERFDHPVVSAYEAINGILKKTKLSFSLFHHGALGEVGIASGIVGKTANLYFNPVKIYKALARGESEVFKNEVIARDSIEHGVQYGATADIPVSKIQGYLEDMARVSNDLPLINKVTLFLSDANSVWDKALWSYLHDTLKLYGYESLVGKLDPKLNAEQTRMAKEEIAQFVNDTFGGQNWENLMMSPKEVQMMTWSLLSADWTMSTTRQALAVTGLGSVYKETKGIRKGAGWKFWARAGLYFGIGMNLLNALYRDKDMEDNPQYYEDKDYEFTDKTMFGNTIGKTTYLFNGRYEDGTERYVRWGKQFRDFFELLIDPLKKIGGKAAPVPQLVSEIFTGHTLSGFKNDDVYKTKGLEKAKGIIKTIAKAPLPISVLRYMREDIEFRALDTVMQSSKGMSRYSAMEYFKRSIVDGDEETLRDTYVGALRNNLPAYTLFTSALSWAESEATAALAENTRDIEDIKVKLYTAESASDKKRYGKILGRLEKEKADKKIGFKLFKASVGRARVYKELEHKAPRLP